MGGREARGRAEVGIQRRQAQNNQVPRLSGKLRDGPRYLAVQRIRGDGDPLDVIVLGPAVPRGSVIQAKLIGVLKLLDGGERDDKLIAVLRDSPFYKVDSLDELDAEFNGVTDILQTWFSNYKGPGETEANGFGDKREATRILDSAIKEFSASQKMDTVNTM